MARQTLSPAAFKAMFAQETDEVFLMCLTLQHQSFQDNLRVVYNNQPITKPDPLIGGNWAYSPALFEVNLPEESPDKIPQVQLTIDNIDRSIGNLVRGINAPRIQMVMEVVMASSPSHVEAGPFYFWLLQCSYDANKVTGTLGFEDEVVNAVFPSLTYTPNNSPGLFR